MKTKEAVVLAAGLGTRMRPVTESLPKCSIPFMGKPLLHWTLEKLEESGIERAFINLHHLPKEVMRTAESYEGRIEILFSFEQEILGTAGFLKPLVNRIKGSSFLVVNSDIIFSFPLDELEETLEEDNDSLACLALRRDSGSYTPIDKKTDGRITSIGKGDYTFLGIYMARKEFISGLPERDRSELVPDLIEPAIPSGKIRGVELEGSWLDLGTPDNYLTAILSQLSDKATWPPVPDGFSLEEYCQRPVLCHRKAWVSQDAFFTGPAYIGPNCRVEPGTRLGNCALLSGACLGEGDALEFGILTPNGRLSVRMGEQT